MAIHDWFVLALLAGLLRPGLPTSASAVYIQVAAAVTLSGWMVIGFNDALVMTGLSIPKVTGLSNTINTM